MKVSSLLSGISDVNTVLLRCFLLLTLLCVSSCSSLTSLYFYPQTVWIQTPKALGLEYQDIWLQAADGTELHSWWLPAQPRCEMEATNTIVLYLHGNAENISSHIRSVEWLPHQGISVLALDYRGFGASQGQAVMPSVLQDIEAAAIWIKQHHPDKELVVLGQSIGAALAVNFVARAQQQYQIKALLLDAPFAGFPQIARSALTSSWLGWLFVPLTWLIPSDWNPDDQASEITIPTLVMHSPKDQVIPYAHGRRIFQRLAGQRCWLDSQGPHIASFSYEKIRLVSQFFIRGRSCAQVSSLLALP